MWTEFNHFFIVALADKLQQKTGINSTTRPEICCHATLQNVNALLYNSAAIIQCTNDADVVTCWEWRNSTARATLRVNIKMSSSMSTVTVELSFSQSFSVMSHNSNSITGAASINIWCYVARNYGALLVPLQKIFLSDAHQITIFSAVVPAGLSEKQQNRLLETKVKWLVHTGTNKQAVYYTASQNDNTIEYLHYIVYRGTTPICKVPIFLGESYEYRKLCSC